jgi:hypothetical protein
MVKKYPICPQRVRKIPTQFSWVDHRLVREHYIEQCSHPAATLYLFLVTVSDCQGLSYYSDPAISKRLSMAPESLEQAREELIQLDLIAYKNPLYQVLPLDHPTPCAPANRVSAQPQSLGQIFKQIIMEVRS